MRAWQTIFVAIVSMDIESAESIHTLELAEAIERYFGGTSDELKQLSSLFLVK
jgi:hypothetical protein